MIGDRATRAGGSRLPVMLLAVVMHLAASCTTGTTAASTTAAPTTAAPTTTTGATSTTSGSVISTRPTTTATAPATSPPAQTTAAAAPVDPYSQPGWVAAENMRPGSSEWRIAEQSTDHVSNLPQAWIEGYASTAGAQHEQVVTLFVDTPADQFRVRAFRMGWYGGLQARLIWTSPPVPGGRQAPAEYDPGTGLAEAPWNPSLTFEVTSEWPPGAYLLRLETDGGGAHFVPLTIRHDEAAGDLLLMSAVTTWQAYNPWGGCTLYTCFQPRRQQRATTVSFDRPYAHSYAQGAADFPTHELPLISFIEEQGLDVAYITSLDLHSDPRLATSRRALLSTGHDEYYSPPMRGALVDALAAGTNLAFFGANAVYRNIRLEPGMGGAPDRRMANHRSTADPDAGDDPLGVTVNWRDAPLNRPESEIVGLSYGCAGVRADMRLVNTSSWVFFGTGAADGQQLDDLVGVEFDELPPAAETPDNLEVLAASPLRCHTARYQQVTAYHTTASGSGVFAAGTIDWSCGLDGSCSGIDRMEVVRGVTANVLRAFAAGPAGVEHPSTGNTAGFRPNP